ncbi:MAG: PilZ domain-containing protein, partial [Planctomycetota bacterium]
MTPPEEKRREPRIQPFVAPCRYSCGDLQSSGFLTDISTSGGRVHTEAEPPAVGASVEVRARLGGQATHVLLPGTVRWRSRAERG